MALSKEARVYQLSRIFPVTLVERSPRFVDVHFSVSLPCVSLSSSFLSVSLFLYVLSDKLDEILAAAQQTISNNEAPGTRGQGPKRDRGRSFYGNEVCIVHTRTGKVANGIYV